MHVECDLIDVCKGDAEFDRGIPRISMNQSDVILQQQRTTLSDIYIGIGSHHHPLLS